MKSMKRQKDMKLKDESPRMEGVQYVTEYEQGAITNSSRKNEVSGSKWKELSAVDVSGGKSKLQCYKKQYCIRTKNAGSMNRGKFDTVTQEMTRVNTDILGISKLKWKGMGEFNSDDHYIYYCGQEQLRRNGVVHVVIKRT